MILLRLYVVPFIHEYKLGTSHFWRKVVNLLPWNNLHKLRDIVDTMHETSVELFNDKKKALANDENAFKTDRKDLMSVLSSFLPVVPLSLLTSFLVHANSKASEEDKLPDDQVLAQISRVSGALWT